MEATPLADLPAGCILLLVVDLNCHCQCSVLEPCHTSGHGLLLVLPVQLSLQLRLQVEVTVSGTACQWPG
jgi:hypothetical protein